MNSKKNQLIEFFAKEQKRKSILKDMEIKLRLYRFKDTKDVLVDLEEVLKKNDL